MVNMRKIYKYALTPLVGTILILAIIVSSTAIVMLWGLPYIEQSRSESQNRAILGQFKVIDGVISSLRYGGGRMEREVTIREGYVGIDPKGDRMICMYSYNRSYDFTVEGLDDEDRRFSFSSSDVKPDWVKVYWFDRDPSLILTAEQDVNIYGRNYSIAIPGGIDVNHTYIKFPFIDSWGLPLRDRGLEEDQIVSATLRVYFDNMNKSKGSSWDGNVLIYRLEGSNGQNWDESWNYTDIYNIPITDETGVTNFTADAPGYITASVTDIFRNSYQNQSNNFCSLMIRSFQYAIEDVEGGCSDGPFLEIGSRSVNMFLRFYSREGLMDGPSYPPQLVINYTGKIKPVATTLGVENIKPTSAVLKGRLEDMGGSGKCDVGFYYGTTSACNNKKHVDQLTSTGEYSYELTGLSPGTKYYFRAYAENEKGEIKGTVMSFTTPESSDDIPPGKINDLTITAYSYNSATLRWTAPGDDGYNGTAFGYVVKYSTSGEINESNWDDACTYDQSWDPKSNGSTEIHTVYGLQSNTTYWFAIKAYDEVYNYGNVSNSPCCTTPEDSTPPYVRVIKPSGGENLTAGEFYTIEWSAYDDESGVSRVDIYYSTDGGVNYTLIADNLLNTGEYQWIVPQANSDNCRIKIVAYNGGGLSAENESGAFSIYTVSQRYLKIVYRGSEIEIPDNTLIGRGERINGSSVEFNETGAFQGFVNSTWSVTGDAGGSTTNTTKPGSNATFYADTPLGKNVWTARSTNSSSLDRVVFIVASDSDNITSSNNNFVAKKSLVGTLCIEFYNKSYYNGLIPFGRVWLFDLGSIYYKLPSSVGTYRTIMENNGIVVASSSGGFIIKDPVIYEDEESLVLNILQIRTESTSGIEMGGSGDYRIGLESRDNIEFDHNTVYNLKLQFYGENADAWLDYFAREHDFDRGVTNTILYIRDQVDITINDFVIKADIEVIK